MAGSPRSQRLVRASRSSVQGFASGFLPTPPRDDAVASGSGLASPPPLEDFHLQALAHAGRTMSGGRRSLPPVKTPWRNCRVPQPAAERPDANLDRRQIGRASPPGAEL